MLTALAEIVKRTNRSEVTIGVDGSLYKYHPRMHNYLTDFISVLISKNTKVSKIYSVWYEQNCKIIKITFINLTNFPS